MKQIDKIEEGFSKAIALHFVPSIEGGMAIVLLIFLQQGVGTQAMLDLFGLADPADLRLILKREGNMVKASLVSKATADAINLKQLHINPSELDAFIANEPKNENFGFGIGFGNHGRIVMESPESPPLIVVMGGYDIK